MPIWGWWEANLATECYTCSEYISEILNLDETGTISFEDFNKRILNEEQGPTTVRSFRCTVDVGSRLFIKTPKGSVWMRSKICFREVNDKGNTIVYGIAEMQDGPDTAIACQALQRSERLYIIFIRICLLALSCIIRREYWSTSMIKN